jgi:hypothetical protein
MQARYIIRFQDHGDNEPIRRIVRFGRVKAKKTYSRLFAKHKALSRYCAFDQSEELVKQQ